MEFPKKYEYIGPKRILKRVVQEYMGLEISQKEDIEKWIKETNQKISKDQLIVATFVINKSGKLLISDRHSEHVQCANGENVLSAGEIGFEIENNKLQRVSFISNQSTGYCPSPKSWDKVEECLRKINDLEFPDYFNPKFIFSYCPNCKTLKIIKEDFYLCYRCDGELYDEATFQNNRKNLESQ